MDIGVYRDAIVKRLQDAADAQTQMALNTQPRSASPGIAAMNSDEYAMTQINHLATARALLFALNAVHDEYKRLTQPEKKQEDEESKPRRRPAYG